MNDVHGRHDVAIVGIGCRFAGAADLVDYWGLTVEGRDAFSKVPADRWNHAAVYDPNPRVADKTYTDRGAFIDDIKSFPAVALQIPPRRVEVMDPQQRLALECALQAVQDAGVAPRELPRRTGVYIGVTAMEYRTLLSTRVMAQLVADGEFGTPPESPSGIARGVERIVQPRPFTAAGTLANMTAATIAQELRLTGPAFTVDAACSSALVAVADAVRALRAGEVEVALAGGAYLCVTPEHYIAFSRIGAMSRAGQCLPFDERADGFLQGDGAGVVVLKRLADAERDGDRVYAVIRGVALNNDGGGDGPMAPVKSGQVEVIDLAWRDAGADPAHLGYVETHGTGTAVGDVIEFEGLVERLGANVQRAALGSAKANIGHTMSAAGIAGLIRAAMAVYAGVRPPMANFGHPKADLNLDASPFYVPTVAEAWDDPERLACVSAFGFGGTNAHAVLAAAPRPEATSVAAARPQLVTLSAPTEAALRRLAANTARALAEAPACTVAGVARATATRLAQPWRLAVVAATVPELGETLREVGEGGCPKGAFIGEAPAKAPSVAMLFPGQGSQRVGMLASIRDRYAEVSEVLAECDAATAGVTKLPLSHYLYPERRAQPVDSELADAELTATENCQPALVACGVALARLLARANVRPVVTAGHSVGEFTAAVVSGAMSLAEGARWAAVRGAAMAAIEGDPGAMLAVRADAATAAGLLVHGAVVANVNHPRQTVVSGTTDAVAQVRRRAEAAGIVAAPLKVSHAFHSPVLAGLDLDAVVDGLALQAPAIPVASCINDHPYADVGEVRDVFKRHATSPVQFVKTVEQCAALGADIYLQVGAGGPLLSFVKASLAGRAPLAALTAASTDDADAGASLLETLAHLWCLGVPVAVDALCDIAPAVTLPAAVLPREHYWAVRETGAALDLTATGAHRVPSANVPAVEAPTPAAEPVAARGGRSAVAELVFAAVARASAYPIEALRGEMRLSDELGFDSMMIADLAEDLVRTVPGLTGIPRELLIASPKIEDLVAFCEDPAAGASDPADDDAPVLRYAVAWTSAPLRRAGEIPQPVFVSGPGAVAPLRDALRACGVAVADSVGAAASWIYTTVGVELPPVSAILADEAEMPDLAAPFLAEAATAGARPVALVREIDEPWSEALAGAVRSLAREWTGARCKSIGVDATAASPAALVAALADELGGEDATVDVRYQGATRRVMGTKEIREVPAQLAVGPDDTIVVTGGTRGIGLAVARQLAAAGARVVIAGRGPLTEDAAAFVAASEGRVVHAAVDVTDRAAVRRALAPFAPVTVLVHSAGVLADGAVETVEGGAGALARAVKAGGFLNALVAVNGSLRVALAIGSWAGRFGSRHQAHYGAANALLSELVTRLPARIRGVCAEFGPWVESEMAATIPESVRASMRADGVDFVTDRAGVAALLTELGGGRGVVVQGRRVAPTTRVVRRTEVLAVATHPYLADHAVDGRPVLPLAGAAAMFANTARLEPPFELRDTTLFQGVVVDEPRKVATTYSGGRFELRGAKHLHYSASGGAVAADVVDPGPRLGGDPPTMSVDEFYRDATFHGPLLRGIAAIDGVGEDFVRGRVTVGRPTDWIPASPESRWAIDPLALDSAFQLAAYVAYTRFGRAGTPVSMRRYVQLQPMPEPGATVTAECVFAEPADGDRFAADVYFRDEAGTLLAAVEQVVAQLRTVERAADAAAVEVKPEWVSFAAWPEIKDLDLRFQMVAALGLQNPYFDLHQGTARDTSRIGDRDVINFSSYNYLGYSGDPRVIADVAAAVERYGTSVSASRIASGERPFHRELEAELASALDVEDCIVFSSGHATNVTVIGHLFGPKDLILHDELIHDSCLQGIKLSGAARRSYRHEDVAHCEAQLRELRAHYERVLIVTEGVYSMDGDVSQTAAFVELKRRYGCLLMVDEAHSFGTIGARGLGIREHHGLRGADVDLWMGTMSKSLASTGGWIGGAKPLITYLRYTAPGFVFAAGITPALGQAALSSLRLMLVEPERVAKLQSNARFFANALTSRGLDVGVARGESPVVPVVTGDSMQALYLSAALLEKGINAKPIIYPAVANDAARLRFFLSSLHSEDQLEHTAETIRVELAKIRAQ
ncbi:MAG: aminotransferase class I/II-fold pyridoxal phosphate-dependent enzyme [Myxococcales bacterium]|nr:aminotransferase class I/II-fold pyridoxal phosphate-dependent enzyme [Myxococcales bacterium]